MNFQKTIVDYLSRNHQFILVDSRGFIIESTDSLFELADFINEPLGAIFPFLTDYITEAGKLKAGDEIELDCMEFDLMERKGTYDLRFSKTYSDGKIAVLVSIEDRTKHYKSAQYFHQQNIKSTLDKDIILRQTQIIHQQNEEIKTLIKETHHRIKNNLQIINSLLNFQSKEITDPIVSGMFDDVRNRVHSMALLHEKFYQTYSLKNVNVKEYLSSLVYELIENSRVNKQITTDVNIENIDIGAKTLVPLGLLINELVTNSIKHGFKQKEHGHINIQLKKRNSGMYELIIADDGIGFSDNIFNKSPESLGTELIQIFAEQLFGKISIENKNGAVIKVEFSQID